MAARTIPLSRLSVTEKDSERSTLGTRLKQIREQYEGNIDGLDGWQTRYVALRTEVRDNADGAGENVYTAQQLTDTNNLGGELVGQLVAYVVNLPPAVIATADQDALIAWVNSFPGVTAART